VKLNAHLAALAVALSSTLAVTVTFAGCGGEPAAAEITPSLDGDMKSHTDTGAVVESRSALSGTGGAGGATGASPYVVYLAYADGNPLPKTDPNACSGTAPKFNCTFGSSLLDCQRQVQAYLDRWYADFNVIFTLTRPTSGAFYTEVVSSGGGAWCGVEARVAGVAPFLCKDLDGGVAYTFLGGADAKQTATIIAQEQAHLVGLEHTSSNQDVMLATICTDCDGFEDAENSVTTDRCNRPTQNSYQMMLDRLGPWAGGPKPSAFGCQATSAPPTVQILEPADKSTVGHDFSVRVNPLGDCKVANVEVSVTPQRLRASAAAPPYQWDLTNISGSQTITVTVTDERGKTGTSAVTVNASGGATAMAGDPTGKAGGCSVAAGAEGSNGGPRSTVTGFFAGFFATFGAGLALALFGRLGPRRSRAGGARR
jgi:hypothetical protein